MFETMKYISTCCKEVKKRMTRSHDSGNVCFENSYKNAVSYGAPI